jgi:UTP-glucose-1-phosphate uridylyltransferase
LPFTFPKAVIYKAISEVKPDENGEIQLADALKMLVEWNCKVYGLKLNPTERRVDIDTAESYLAMLKSVVMGK